MATKNRIRVEEGRKRRAKMEALGLCVKCGRAPRTLTSKRCALCSEKHRTEVKVRKMVWLGDGRCLVCGKPRENQYVQMCTYCSLIQYTRYRHKRKARALRDKLLVFKAYGGVKCNCPGCDETNIKFLTIDHISGGGAKERKITGSGLTFYRHLIKNKFPSGFQVLCWNCNCGRNANKGICPHLDS